MSMSKEEKASLEALKNGATLEEALAMLPTPTPEFLETLDERGDFIQEPESREYSTTEQETK